MGSEHFIMPSFNFMLLVDGGIEIPLKSVQPFARENEYEPIQEGGMNDYVYLKRKPISQPFKLVVERYVDYTLTLADPLSNGTELLLPLLLFIGNNTGGSTTYARYYTFTGAVVMGKQYGGLDAEKSGLLTETVTFGYNHMFCTNLPLSEDVTDAKWKMGKEKKGQTPLYSVRGFDVEENKTKEADFIEKAKRYNVKEPKDPKSVKSARTTPKSSGDPKEKAGDVEYTRAQMINKAKLFKWNKDGVYTGEGDRQARVNESAKEKRKDKMIESAKEWHFKEKTKAGEGTASAQNYLVTSKKELPDGSVVGLGIPEDPKEKMAEKAVRKVMNTDNHTDGNKGIPPRKWEFDDKEPATKAGKGARSRQNAIADENGDIISGKGPAEATIAQMAEKSKKWAFGEDKGIKNGNEVQSARKVKEIVEESEEDLTQKARKWKITDKYTKEGGGVSSRKPPEVPETSRGNMVDKAVRHIKNTDNGTSGNTGIDPRRWEFDEKEPATKAGKGTASRKPAEPAEPTQADLAGKAVHNVKNTDNHTDGNTGIEPRKWNFDDKEPATKAGKGTASRKPANPAEPSKDEMAKKAVRHVKQSITDFLMG